MPAIQSHLWIIGVCVPLVAGAAGGNRGSGGGSTSGGGGNISASVTITLSGTSTPVVVAAKIGSGAFVAQTLSESSQINGPKVPFDELSQVLSRPHLPGNDSLYQLWGKPAYFPKATTSSPRNSYAMSEGES